MVDRIKVTQLQTGSWAVLVDGSRLPSRTLARKEAISRALEEARESEHHPVVYIESHTGAVQPRVV